MVIPCSDKIIAMQGSTLYVLSQAHMRDYPGKGTRHDYFCDTVINSTFYI